MLVCIGALMPWVRTTFVGIPDEISPTYVGIDIADGKVVFGLGIAVLAGLIASSVRRVGVECPLGGGRRDRRGVRRDGRRVVMVFTSSRFQDSAVESVLAQFESPTAEMHAQVEELIGLELSAGPFVAIGGGVLAVVGGALTLAAVNPRDRRRGRDGLELREVLALRADALGGCPELRQLVLVEVELDDLLDAAAAQRRRHADVDVVDAVLAGRPCADGQHGMRVVHDRPRPWPRRRRWARSRRNRSSSSPTISAPPSRVRWKSCSSVGLVDQLGQRPAVDGRLARQRDHGVSVGAQRHRLDLRRAHAGDLG